MADRLVVSPQQLFGSTRNPLGVEQVLMSFWFNITLGLDVQSHDVWFVEYLILFVFLFSFLISTQFIYYTTPQAFIF